MNAPTASAAMHRWCARIGMSESCDRWCTSCGCKQPLGHDDACFDGTLRRAGYHSSMRRWFFVLLILLLPLRGWVGDAMAMQMALPGQHAPASGPMQHADGHSEPAHAHLSPVALAAADDCGEHTTAQDPGDESDSAHCEACAMCQTCHTVAVLQPAVLLATGQVSPTPPAGNMHGFVSADRALLLKPPIY